MSEEENNENNNSKFLEKIDIDNRSPRKSLTKIEFPKIPKPTRKSVCKTQIYKFLLKTEDEKEYEQKIMNKIIRHSTPWDFCIGALKRNPSERSEELIKIISFYLQMLKNFMNIFKDQIESEELQELLYNMSSKLRYEHIDKNRFIFKYGDKANKFYIILKGRVTFCVPKISKHYLNEEEYILYLIKLRLNKEIDLIKKNMDNNRFTYDLGDNFDLFVLKSLRRHEKEEEKIYSDVIYSYFKKIKEIIEKEKEKEKEKRNKRKEKEENKYEEINIEKYLERSAIDTNTTPDEEKKNNRKLLEIYKYERTNTFENGDCFGLVGSNNKSHKRSATAISYDDCELAILFREEYNEIIKKITEESRERLYKLVISHKIFFQISKRTFSNKYSHMFRFNKFYFNNLIMDETKQFNQVIIFNLGEFILSINKNIIELNELIIKIKTIKGNILNKSEELIKKDLTEIKENEAFILNKKYTPNAINEFIYKKQNLIISTINDKMILGYPDTVDPETFMPLFNCKCISNFATGYIVEREMINLFKKDHYLRTTPSEILLLKIEFYLKRLLQHKKNIMKRIEILKMTNKQINKNITNNNYNSNINERSKEDLKDNNDITNNCPSTSKKELNQKYNEEKNNCNNEETENNLNISRNNINPINTKNNNIFEFQTKIISSQLEPINKNLTSFNNIRKTNYSLDNTITQNNKENNNFFREISKMKQKIDKKKYLLRAIQNQSHKFITKENVDNKKIQIKLNKYNYKENYNDLTTIFSKDPDQKKSILDKYLKKSEDNVLDPEINNINRQINYEKKIFSFLPNSCRVTNTDINQNNSRINNISIIMNNNNNYKNHQLYKKIKNKLISKENNENNQKDYTLNNSFNNNSKRRIKKSLLLSPFDSEVNNIKLKYNNLSLDVNKVKNKYFHLNKNNLKILSNELYNDYIVNELNKRHIHNIHNILNDKSKTNEFEYKNSKIDNLLHSYQKLDNYKINKIQLMKTSKERDIKSNYFSSIQHSYNPEKKGISLVDPLLLDKFNQKYRKEKINEND